MKIIRGQPVAGKPARSRAAVAAREHSRLASPSKKKPSRKVGTSASMASMDQSCASMAMMHIRSVRIASTCCCVTSNKRA
jgi:hypothetical protein